MADLATDVEAYARLAAELADPRTDRGAVLARHGLDEDAWDAVDDSWHERLAEAADTHDGDEVPPLVLAHADAFAKAQRARVADVLSFERFTEVARAVRRGGDLGPTLRQLGVTLDAFLRAQAHWTDQMIQDDELAERFRRALG